MYLVKISRSTSTDVSIYYEKCEASFKIIEIIKSLGYNFKVTSLHFRQKIDFWVTFVLNVFTKLHIFYKRSLCNC